MQWIKNAIKMIRRTKMENRQWNVLFPSFFVSSTRFVSSTPSLKWDKRPEAKLFFSCHNFGWWHLFLSRRKRLNRRRTTAATTNYYPSASSQTSTSTHKTNPSSACPVSSNRRIREPRFYTTATPTQWSFLRHIEASGHDDAPSARTTMTTKLFKYARTPKYIKTEWRAGVARVVRYGRMCVVHRLTIFCHEWGEIWPGIFVEPNNNNILINKGRVQDRHRSHSCPVTDTKRIISLITPRVLIHQSSSSAKKSTIPCVC